MTGLIYIGNGAALIGVPARDLTEEEVKELEKEFDRKTILRSGLYQLTEAEALELANESEQEKVSLADKKPYRIKAKKESD